jgi:hypothetical protein
MRTRLATCVGFWVGLAAVASAPARAEDHADIKASYFIEPASQQRLQVIRPQADISVDLGRPVSLQLGYDADIVTGATPRTYSRIDALSAATSFSDQRHAFHAGLEYRTGNVTVDGRYSYAFEHDYRSHVVDVGARVDLLGKNTTLALDYSHNFDSVCDADNRGATPLQRQALETSDNCFKDGVKGVVTEPLAIDAYQASWTQIVTPRILFQLVAGLEVLDGFQSNPYRRVRLFDGAAEAQEAEPYLRQRYSVTGRARWAVPQMRAAIGAEGRFYWDTWGIKSGSAQVDVEAHLTDRLTLRLRGRFYQQSRAVFYRDAGESLSYEAVGPVGQYFTGDRELSPFRDWLLGGKISWVKSAGEKGRLAKMFTDVDLNLKLDLINYQALTPDPPNFARTQGFIDAAILQLGVTARF